MKKNKQPMLGEMLEKIAPKIGATIVREPVWGVVCQINFKNGKKRYSRYNSIDLNSLGASEIAKDKDYSNFFMKQMGYPTIKGHAFYSPSWAKAIGSKDTIDAGYAYAQKMGFPVIVKPNSASQGVGVALVYTKQEFYKAMRSIFKSDKVALVQKQVTGKDYRIVVLDSHIISAYQRIPLSVIGNGRSSIRTLLLAKKKLFKTIDRDIKIQGTDPRIITKLAHNRMTLSSIPKSGEVIYLLDNANLSQGGDSIDVTNEIHPLFKKISIHLAKDMGLRLCGVDLMIRGDIKDKPGKYWVIEVNSAPGLDHYVTTGEAQAQIVEDLYLEVLKSMGK